MPRGQERDRFDITCLRAIQADPHARRHALAAAMIKLHAPSIARRRPQLREEALQIVHHAQRLYAERVTRAAVGAVVRAHVSPSREPDAARIDELIDALWALISTGRG